VIGKRPLISVLIPVYNGEAYLAEAIDSVLTQSYRPIEVVVVDDGSDDGTDEIACGYGAEVRYERQPRAGNGAARNRAVSLARGDLFAFLDADDRLVPGSLDRLAGVLHDTPSLQAVYGHVREFVSPDIDAAALARLRPPVDRAAGCLPTNMLMRRDAFFEVGEFSTSLRVGVTVDWAARADERDFRRVLLDDVLFERRLHGSNNGIREREHRSSYVRVVKAALDRRRALSERTPTPAPGLAARTEPDGEIEA
jgi:glycosyltransferase involved in cell wall biosynthesis